jgi:hypothetical protein
MARKKLKDKNIRKLTKMGGGRSMGLTLPMEIVKELKWKERQKVVVRLKRPTGGGYPEIIIKDWEK